MGVTHGKAKTLKKELHTNIFFPLGDWYGTWDMIYIYCSACMHDLTE